MRRDESEVRRGSALLGVMAIVVVVVATLSLGVVPGIPAPSIFAPAPVLLVFPIFMGVPIPLVLVVPLLLSVVWCHRLTSGDPSLPVRTLVLIALICAGSLWNFVVGWEFGLRFQGHYYAAITAATSVVLMLLTVGAAAMARQRPSLVSSAAAHGLLFSWMFSYAFTYLGETP
jgi:hypothetical protein